MDALACALRQLEADGHAKCGCFAMWVTDTLAHLLTCRLFKGDTADDQGVKFFTK